MLPTGSINDVTYLFKSSSAKEFWHRLDETGISIAVYTIKRIATKAVVAINYSKSAMTGYNR